MKLLAVKKLGKLHPADETAMQAFAKLPNNEPFFIEVKRPRNIKHHRLFFALCNLVASNSTRYPDAEAVATALKIATGHVTPFVHPITGQTYWTPKSIAFHNMGQLEFGQFFDKCVDIVATRLLPGVTDQELRAELESMCGLAERAA